MVALRSMLRLLKMVAEHVLRTRNRYSEAGMRLVKLYVSIVTSANVQEVADALRMKARYELAHDAADHE